MPRNRIRTAQGMDGPVTARARGRDRNGPGSRPGLRELAELLYPSRIGVWEHDDGTYCEDKAQRRPCQRDHRWREFEVGIMGETTCGTCKGSGLRPERYMGDPQGQRPCPACNGTGKVPA